MRGLLLLSYGFQRKKRREGKERENSNSNKSPSTKTFLDTAFRKNLFFFDFCPKMTIFKKKKKKKTPRIGIIDGLTPKLSRGDLKQMQLSSI